MTFYGNMQALAGDLLTEFDQGGLELQVYSAGSGDPWDPGPPTYTSLPFRGTVRGVSAEHLQDTLIQSGDLVVTMPGTMSPKMQDRVLIGGRKYHVVKLESKPATGVAAAWAVFVRA